MNERLREFVLGISTDLERARQFSADPTAELDQAGLSPEEREIVLRRDPDALREAIGLAPYDPMSLEGFFEKPAPPAETPGKPREPKAPARRKPARRKPAKKAPSKKAPARKAPVKKVPAKKTGKKGSAKRTAPKRGGRKTTRKATRKGPGRRR